MIGIPSNGSLNRRSALAGALLWGLGALGHAQGPEPTLARPGEQIDLQSLTVSLLGADIRRGRPTTVTLRLRAQAGSSVDGLIDLDAFRLYAAGVPRAPVYATTDERKMSSFLVPRESAVDFTRVFQFTDKTDDLVLQIRVGDAVERRRLAPR